MVGRRKRAAALVGVVFLLYMLLAATAARADYTVNVCRHADGTPAPTDGFAFSAPQPYDGLAQRDNTCSSSGSVTVALAQGSHGVGSPTQGTNVTWGNSVSKASLPGPITRAVTYSAGSLERNFHSGSDLVVSDVGHLCSFEASGSTVPESGNCFTTDGNSTSPTFPGLGWGDPRTPLADANRAAYTVQPGGLGSFVLEVFVGCGYDGAASPPNPYCQQDGTSRVQIFRTAYTVADTKSPTSSTAPATDMPTLSGSTNSVTASASDNAGIYSAQPVVDGNLVGSSTVVDSNGGRCVTQGDGSFDYIAPCPATVSGKVNADISSVANGSHKLALRYRDISGNTVDSPTADVNVDNTPKFSGGPNVVVPAGTLKVGTQLTADPGTVSPSGATLLYQWLRCPPLTNTGCVAIAGATSQTYTVDQADLQHSLALQVTATVGQTSGSAASGPTPVVQTDSTGHLISGSAFANPVIGTGHGHNGSGAAESATVAAAIQYRTKVRVKRKGHRSKSKTVTRRTTSKTLSSGHTLTAVGKLVGVDGQPISGAKLSIIATPQGGSVTQFGTATTGSSGSFTFKISWGPIRKIQVGYYAFGDDIQPDVSRVLSARGTARVTVSGRALSRSRLSYTGRVVGAPKGVIIRLQNRSGRRRWSTFASPRTKTGGAFSSVRRLTRTARGSLVCARARAVTQAGLPYATSNSRTVCARVR